MMLLSDINAQGDYQMGGIVHPGVTQQPPQINGLNGLSPAFLGDMQVNGMSRLTPARSAPLS